LAEIKSFVFLFSVPGVKGLEIWEKHVVGIVEMSDWEEFHLITFGSAGY
jgi:hypothetical protein